MYAVIETGGKQVRVQAGEFIQIEKLAGEVGTKVTFDKVLFVSNPSESNSEVTIGQPYVSNAKDEAEIVAQGRDKKILIIKMKRRKQYRRTQGHRQEQTQLLVTGLTNGASLKTELSAADKKVKLAKFFTNLKPKGPARQTKTLGSRKRMAAAKAAPAATAKKTAKKTTAKA
jgi:large subunit ribosomal protein L21